MATKSKRVQVETLRAPAEIRDNTKARRAWNADAIAKKVAEGFEAVVREKGSYEYVAVYQTTEVEGREQKRGVCQGCAGSYALVDGQSMVHHGYQRPGHGYIVGDCQGVAKLAANFSIDYTRTLIESLRAMATGCRESAAKFKAEADAIAIPLDLWQHGRAIALERDNARRELERRARDAEFLAYNNETYATHLEERAIPALGTPLTVVIL